MNKFQRPLLLMLIGLICIFIFSCKDKDKDNPTAPATPNFETWDDEIWAFQNTIWLELDYFDAKSTLAECTVLLSAKGSNPFVSLKLNAKTVAFDETNQYTAGTLFWAYMDTLETAQPVAYELVTAKGSYTGSITVPQMVTGSFPALDPLTDYQASWSFTPDNNISPNFNVFEFGVQNLEEYNYRWMRKQLAGTDRTYTVSKTFWADFTAVSDYVDAYIDAFTYSMQHDNTILTVGYHYDSGDKGIQQSMQNQHDLKHSLGKALYYIDRDRKGLNL